MQHLLALVCWYLFPFLCCLSLRSYAELRSRSPPLARGDTSPPQQGVSRHLIQSLSLSRTQILPTLMNRDSSAQSHADTSSLHPDRLSRILTELRSTNSGLVSIVTRIVPPSRSPPVVCSLHASYFLVSLLPHLMSLLFHAILRYGSLFLIFTQQILTVLDCLCPLDRGSLVLSRLRSHSLTSAARSLFLHQRCLFHVAQVVHFFDGLHVLHVLPVLHGCHSILLSPPFLLSHTGTSLLNFCVLCLPFSFATICPCFLTLAAAHINLPHQVSSMYHAFSSICGDLSSSYFDNTIFLMQRRVGLYLAFYTSSSSASPKYESHRTHSSVTDCYKIDSHCDLLCSRRCLQQLCPSIIQCFLHNIRTACPYDALLTALSFNPQSSSLSLHLQILCQREQLASLIY